MNERIRELALQAGEYVNSVYTPPVRSKTPDKIWEDGHVDWHTQFNQKFAELIVQECMAQCEQVATAADAKSKSKFVTDDGRMLHEGMWGGAKNCSGQIKQHFGVAE
jgi:hypothetical protein